MGSAQRKHPEPPPAKDNGQTPTRKNARRDLDERTKIDVAPEEVLRTLLTKRKRRG